MAKTRASYRLGRRTARTANKLNAFANGMYWTNQVIPDGYAKVLVNFDIDDTGSFIKPRAGRIQDTVFEKETPFIGAAHITDFLYSYNAEGTELIDLQDVVISFGSDKTEASIPGYVLSNYVKRVYEVPSDPTIYRESNVSPSWSLYWNALDNTFKQINTYVEGATNNLGSVTTREIINARTLNKEITDVIRIPISTVCNNELYCISSAPGLYEHYENSEYPDSFTQDTPALSKLALVPNAAGSYDLSRRPVVLKNVLPSEAYSTGYNMLSDTPYTFTNRSGASSLTIDGVIPYASGDTTIPKFNFRLGQTYDMHLKYSWSVAVTSFKTKVEWQDLTTLGYELKTLKDFDDGTTTTCGTNTDFIFQYKPDVVASSLIFTIRPANATDDSQDDVYTQQIYCSENINNALELNNFDLLTAKGMVSWYNYIGLYGVKDAPNAIFFSDTENAGYFPYPNNLLTFDGEVLAVYTYLDQLLVVTNDSMYIVTMGTSIGTSVQKCILKNIHITEIDAVNIQILKDQIFFKTATQFYVLKPNKYTSDATDLKNYTNSTAIANFTNNFRDNIVDILNNMYTGELSWISKHIHNDVKDPYWNFFDFDLLDVTSSLRDEDVHYIYRINPIIQKSTKYIDDYTTMTQNLNTRLDVHLIYDTISRAWRLYIETAGETGCHMYSRLAYKNKNSGAYYGFIGFNGTYNTLGLEKNTSGIVVITTSTEYIDDYIPYSVDHYLANCSFIQYGALNDGRDTLFNNIQYIDTGNVALDEVLTKRFREVQFNIVNKRPHREDAYNRETARTTRITMYANFFADSVQQVDSKSYSVEYVDDPEASDYGTLFVTSLDSPNLYVYGETNLAPMEEYFDEVFRQPFWSLDFSRFPKLNIATVRFGLRGKGRHGALRLLCTSFSDYELSSFNWVYRDMSAR